MKGDANLVRERLLDRQGGGVRRAEPSPTTSRHAGDSILGVTVSALPFKPPPHYASWPPRLAPITATGRLAPARTIFNWPAA